MKWIVITSKTVIPKNVWILLKYKGVDSYFVGWCIPTGIANSEGILDTKLFEKYCLIV